MAYDKQKHCAMATYLTAMTFFPLLGYTEDRLTSAIISFIVVGLISWGIEFYQKRFTTDRHFDKWDAIYMQITNVALILLYLIIY
jgi:hypothetical protein